MKKSTLLLICVFFIISLGFVSAYYPLKVFVEDKEVKNNGDYFIKDNKIYVSEDALKNDFGFNVFYDKNDNRIRLYNFEKTSYKLRSELFEKFADLYEPKTADQVAELWAKGVKERNGVFQFVNLSKSLKNDFKAQATSSGRTSWVTGFSSPWVKDYKITKEKINASTWKYKIIFTAVTSAPGTYTWTSVLTVGKENNKWRILQRDGVIDTLCQ